MTTQAADYLYVALDPAALGSERFPKEIELTANLRHPHILPHWKDAVYETLGKEIERVVVQTTRRGS